MVSLASFGSCPNLVELLLSLGSIGLFFRIMICFWLPLILFSIFFPFLVFSSITLACLLFLSCPRAFAYAPFHFLLRPSSHAFTFQISDQMFQITLSKIKLILTSLISCLFFLITLWDIVSSHYSVSPLKECLLCSLLYLQCIRAVSNT